MRDTAAQFFGLLGNFSPGWALALLIAGILSWQSPKIIREFRRKSRR